MSASIRNALVALGVGAFLLAVPTLQAAPMVQGAPISLGESDDISVKVHGFVTVSPGVVSIDQSDNAGSGDPPPELDTALESRVHLTFGSDEFSITASQWTRNDAVICRNAGVGTTGDGDCLLKMVYLDWDITDTVHLHAGRSGNHGNTWNQRTIIWETYMGWTPVLPTGGYFFHWEGNDIIDLTWDLSESFQIGLNAREEPGISSAGATAPSDNLGTAGNLPAASCSAADNDGDGSQDSLCHASLMYGPTFMWSFGPGMRLSGTYQIENQEVEEDNASTAGFDDTTNTLTHTAPLLIYRWDFDDAGSMFGVQYTQLNIEEDSPFQGGDETTVTDWASQLVLNVAGSNFVFANLNTVNWDFDGDERDDLYWDAGWFVNGTYPGSRIGVAFRSLSIDAVDSADDNAVSVAEVNFWQGF